MVVGELICQLKRNHELLQLFHYLQYLWFYDDVYGDACVYVSFVLELMGVLEVGLLYRFHMIHGQLPLDISSMDAIHILHRLGFYNH
jgi:hypothetical protein